MKDKINELATNSNKNIRDLYREINRLQRGNNLVKDEDGDLLVVEELLLKVIECA
jgi:hypothetical protein